MASTVPESVLPAQQAVLIALRAGELAGRSRPGDAGPSLVDGGLRAARAALSAARSGAGAGAALVARSRAVRLHAAAAAAAGAARDAENALLLLRVRLFLAPCAGPDALAAAMAALAAEVAVAAAPRTTRRRVRDCAADEEDASAQVFPGEAFRVVFPTTQDLVACAICLASYAANELARRCSPCNHVYHSECLEKWIATGAAPSCPLCRRPLARCARGGCVDDEGHCAVANGGAA